MPRSSLVRATAALALAGIALATPAAAQMMPPEPDQVTLSLATEGWVETKTAKVTAVIDAALQGADGGRVRGEATKAFEGLVTDTPWRITAFNRMQDPSGLERWNVVAEARVPEKSLAGLADKAQKASRPGLQVKIANIDFTPTLEEREAVIATLRAKLYADADAELKRLNAVLKDRQFRIRQVSFGQAPVPMMAVPKVAMMRSMAADGAVPEEAQISVEQRVVLTAQVVLAQQVAPAAAPKP